MAWAAVWTNNLNALTEEQKQNNVNIIYNYFKPKGWLNQPLAAMLGNIEFEGQLNPAQWENGKPIYGGGATGFGLSQWTPWTKLSNFLGDGWETNYNGQLERLWWEMQPQNEGVQWVRQAAWGNLSFMDFARDTTHSLDWLTACYERCYERGTPSWDQRRAAARKWLTYINNTPIPPTPTPTVIRKMPVWMMCKPYWKR